MAATTRSRSKGTGGSAAAVEDIKPAATAGTTPPAASADKTDNAAPTSSCPVVDPSQPVLFRVGHLGDAYWDWVNVPEQAAPRFFASTWMEGCSKTPWWTVPLLWIPVFSACLLRAVLGHGVAWCTALALALMGVLAWQALEYTIHRCVFHAHTTSYWGITLHFLFHGCHHKYPHDHLRLVFPPLPASALVLAVHHTLHALLPPSQALAVFAGMGFAYVAYDCLHYCIHNATSLPTPLLKDLKRRHAHHHYKDHSTGYGISAVFVDVLMGTSAF